MKIVYCHNYYRHRGGEDVSFDSDVELLRQRGHDVIPFTRDNQKWDAGPIEMAQTAVWNRQVERELSAVLLRHKPDVLHCNNLFPQLSVSVYRPAKQLGIPVVQALRNYRSFCANSFFFRDGEVCTKCLCATAAWHSLIHRCYRDSLAATGSVVAMQFIHRIFRIQQCYVDAFFTPTEFARQIHIAGGFAPERIHCRQNYVLPDLGQTQNKSNEAVFVGRLSPEKGLGTLLDAWQRCGAPLSLKIIGSGPERASLMKHAEAMPGVEFLGELSSLDVLDRISRARFLVMPSRWYETFGRTIAEAFSRGTPVIASRLGAMRELVTDGVDGLHFESGSATSLQVAIQHMLAQTAQQYDSMCNAARQSFEQRFSADVSYESLLRIYRAAQNAKEDAPPGRRVSPIVKKDLGAL